MHEPDQISTGGGYPSGLPRLALPSEGATPDPYMPQGTILQTTNGVRTHAYLWYYLEREMYGKRYRFNPASLSTQRVKDMPKAIECLSKHFCFDNARPGSVSGRLTSGISRFLNWTDRPIHHRRFESILNDPDLALEALKKRHSCLQQHMQTNQTRNHVSVSAASMIDVDAIEMMAATHGREYGNGVEAIKYIHGDDIRTPKTGNVAALMACV